MIVLGIVELHSYSHYDEDLKLQPFDIFFRCR